MKKIWFAEVEFKWRLKPHKNQKVKRYQKRNVKVVVTNETTNGDIIKRIKERIEREDGSISSVIEIINPTIMKKMRLGSEHLPLKEREEKFLKGITRANSDSNDKE